MRITLTPTNPPVIGKSADSIHSCITVEHPYDDLNIDETVTLIKSALCAWGFSEKTVDDCIGAQ